MDEDLLTLPAELPRSDADPVPPPVAVVADDPEAAALSMFSPEAVEILKTLPEADMQVLRELAVTQRGEEAEQAVIEAAGDAPVLEVEDATVPAAPGAITMDMVNKAIVDALAAAGVGKKMDSEGRPKVCAVPAAAPAQPKEAPGQRLDAAEVARRAAAIVSADQAFVDRVRAGGHRCDSLRDANAAAMAVIRNSTPAAATVAERALKDGRRDDFVALFDAAEEVRRADSLSDQFAVLGLAQRGIAADRLDASPTNFTFPARALSGAGE